MAQHFINGIGVTALLYPMDVYVTCRQANTPISWQLSRMYRGMVTSITVKGVYFGLYFNLFHRLREHTNEVVASGVAGLLSTTVTNPGWYLRTILQTQGHAFSHSRDISFLDGVKMMSKHPFKGLTMSVMKNVEVMFRYPLQRRLNREMPSLLATAVCLLVLAPLYPINTIRETYRMLPVKKSYIYVVKLLYGRGALFHGYLAYYVRSLLYYGLLFLLEK